MKKIFSAKRNSLLSVQYFSWGVCALAFALIALLVRLLAPNVFLQITAPVFGVSDALVAQGHSFLASFGSAAGLSAENERLSAENIALASENRALQQKYIDTSALLDVAGTGTGILAGVVARPPESPYDTLLLAAGAKAGVTLGMEAFGDGDVPIGIVSSVLADFSRITLFSAPGMSTSGWVGSKKVPLTIKGQGGGALYASVSRGADTVTGDVVFVPGPGQLPIGTIVRVDGDPLSPGVTLRITPTLNLFGTTWVVLRVTGVAPMQFATSTEL